jgi:hypothetical protein
MLTGPLEADYLAWYLLGRAYGRDGKDGNKLQAAQSMERACRKSVELEPQFARGHRNLALALLLQVRPGDAAAPQTQQAQSAIDRARELDPNLKFQGLYAYAAMWHDDFAAAERHYAAAVAEDPADIHAALGLSFAILRNTNKQGLRAPLIAPLVNRHADDGTLRCFYGLALAIDGQPRAGLEEFRRARELGVDPATLFDPRTLESVEDAARPGLIEIVFWTAVGFVVIYGVVMVLMAVAGVALGSFTRGDGVLRLLPDEPVEIVGGGQVVRSASEPWLARLYGVSLVFGLVLFYVALPFVAAGLLVGTVHVSSTRCAKSRGASIPRR